MMRPTVAAACLLAVAAAVAPHARAEDAKPQHVVGRIASVRPEANVVVVKTRKGEEVTLKIDDKSLLQIDQKDVPLKQFAEGMRVRAVYVSAGDVNRVVALSDPLLTANKVGQALADAFAAAKKFTHEEKEKYARHLQPVLADLDERIDELTERAAEAEPEVRQQFDRDLAEVRRQREIVKEKWARVAAASPDAWDDVKTGVHAAVDDLRMGIENARARVK